MARKLEISNLGKTFGDLRALEDINLAVERGEFIALVGPSGCGKTTFLRIVAGLEPASSGEVTLDGRAVRSPGGDRGFVFQSDNLLPWRTVFANAIIGREVAGHVGPAERQRTMELLKLVGLEGFERYHPRQLSGGMRQRVNLARALAIDPEVLLMDEPFSALDAQTREIMQTELMRIWEQGRKTVLFVTHQIDEAVFLSDRVLVFARRPGRLRETVEIELPRPRALALTRRSVSRGLAAAVAAAGMFPAWRYACAQQHYPSRPVRFIIPFGAAGLADITARLAAEKLGDRLGQRFVVENQPGPGGIAAARTVLSQSPDGYTIGLVTNGTSISAALFKALPFDPVKEFATISTIGAFDLVFATNVDSDLKTLADFITTARAQPGKLNVGTIAVGSTQNLGAELFKSA